jgi:hypothetical protein
MNIEWFESGNMIKSNLGDEDFQIELFVWFDVPDGRYCYSIYINDILQQGKKFFYTESQAKEECQLRLTIFLKSVQSTINNILNEQTN